MTHEPVKLLPFILYVGPDVLMPFASAVAAVVGFLLMFWRRTVTLVKATAQRIAGLFGKR